MNKALRLRTFLRFFGVVLLALSMYLAFLQGVQISGLFLIVLASGAGWLHFRLPPAGRINLSPIAVFASLLLSNPYSAPLIASTAALFSSLVFLRLGFREALEVVLEETAPALSALAVLITSNTNANNPTFGAYALAFIAYSATRAFLGGVTAYFAENVGPSRFVTSTAGRLTANLLFFAIVAFVIRTYLYDQFGFFALALATVALADIYHPWKLLSEQDDVLFASLAMVAQSIDIKDPYTARHSRNVAEIAVRIARAMRLPEREVRKIRIGALMHDIGKVGVSGNIIRKPMKLEPNEDSLMRRHPVLSADIMQPIELLAEAAEIVRHHHEHYDGTGYPDGLRGESIPLGSRVILVADAFDAMTTDRPYRHGRSAREALEILKQHAGRQFDAVAVRALESILDTR